MFSIPTEQASGKGDRHQASFGSFRTLSIALGMEPVPFVRLAFRD